MLIDSRTRFARATALSTAGTTAGLKIGEALDMSVARDLGEGKPLYLYAAMAVDAAGASAVLALQFVTADVEALTTNVEVVYQTPAVAMASLVAGYRFPIVALPYYSYRRWIGLRQVITGAAFSAGAIDAFITADASAWRAYADANN